MSDEVEQAIEETLDGRPRSEEIRLMIEALESRRDAFRRERDAAPEGARRREWNTKLSDVEKQINVLSEELAITQFVENSVRAAANRPRTADNEVNGEW